uniref:Laminin, alpha 3 n=1 Tax=Fundulus heteroclitus TaxID=8078 RepID=A0A3Q2PMX0_FUNHE
MHVKCSPTGLILSRSAKNGQRSSNDGAVLDRSYDFLTSCALIGFLQHIDPEVSFFRCNFKCAPGYYRDTIGLFLGKCVPCNCNGHSDQCLDGSGICQNCQHNTVGERCESCMGGFLSNNTMSCPVIRHVLCVCSFAEGCVQRSDRMQCLCMHGYAGPNCERCAPGFYGNPMVLGSRCQPCHCNGNTDPNMLFTDCHPLTGQCLSCMHNTAGPHCDICAPGYYGDAVRARNCTSEFSFRLPYLFVTARSLHLIGRFSVAMIIHPSVFLTRLTLVGSSSTSHLVVPSARLKTLGSRAFSCSAPTLWNSLPPDICNTGSLPLFKSKLKTHMFKISIILRKKLLSLNLPVLDRVNEELANHQAENLNLTKAIRNRLLRFLSEMMDLREALNEAVNNTGRAAELNSVNEKLLEEINVSNLMNEDLLMKQKEVSDTVDMAVADVTQVNAVVSILQESQQDYEGLAAQLDGARSPLAKKVQTFAATNSLIPLVEKAEKHAELLNALAMNLNVTKEINEAKSLVDKANITATEVNNKLRPIKEQLDQWQQAYGETNSTSDDINKALMNASETVQKLEEHIPTLMKKLDNLQNFSVQMPNISENINRIRKLIQEARNAASKVSVSMKFNGRSAAQVRTPSNLADLAAFTSLKFYISLAEPKTRKRSTGDEESQLVFFLGSKNSDKEFMGMTLTENSYGQYNLMYTFVENSFFRLPCIYRVHVVNLCYVIGLLCHLFQHRILQFGNMAVSSLINGVTVVTKAVGKTEGTEGLLNLLTDDTVFYVGGPPDSFKLPSQLSNSTGFRGCIQLETLNMGVLSLYNFENTFQLNTTADKPCHRSEHVFISQSFSYSSQLSLGLKINSSDGCVLHAAGRQPGGAAMTLSVLKGHLMLSVEAAGSKVKVRSLNRFNDERWHPVRSHTRLFYYLQLSIGCEGFVGCVRDLKLNAVPAGNPSHSQGAVPCFQNPLQPGAYFSGQGGHMEIGNDSLVLGRDLEIRLEVRPASESGLLLHAGSSPDQHLSLVLSQGEVIVSVSGAKGEFSTSLMPDESLCNRRWHTITGGFTSPTCPLSNCLIFFCSPGDVKVNGHPDGFPAFHGCFRHVSINGRRVNLSKPRSVRGAVGTHGCPHM